MLGRVLKTKKNDEKKPGKYPTQSIEKSIEKSVTKRQGSIITSENNGRRLALKSFGPVNIKKLWSYSSLTNLVLWKSVSRILLEVSIVS
jgi:hypothetical protein